MKTSIIFTVFQILLLVAVSGCDDGTQTDSDGDADGDIDVPSDGDADSDADEPLPSCLDDSECDDGLWCNGAEVCDPAASRADDFGCAPGEASCTAEERCDEASDRCTPIDCLEPDADGDGHDVIACGGDDCDDTDPNRYPGNTEVCDPDDHDEDCDPLTFGFRDGDGDGEPDAECCNFDAEGEASCGTDCDDARPGVNPRVPEVCDGLDNDCNGEVDEGVLITFYADADGDGHGSLDPEAATTEDCTQPVGYAASRNDCDDDNAAIHPGAVEECDEIDNNCDGTVDPGCACNDGDTQPCGEPDGSGGFLDEGECAIGSQLCTGGTWGECVGDVRPRDELCNSLDDDCDDATDEGVTTTFYRDADGDGYGDPLAAPVEACSAPGGYVAPNTDCDDTEPGINPGQAEVCDLLGDNDCNAATRPFDDDGDGHDREVCGGDDCDDTRDYTYPEATERCDRLDNDCSSDGGVEPTEDVDDDGFASIVAACAGGPLPRTDCNDSDDTIHPGAIEVCDGVDEDCNGTIDDDPAASASCSLEHATSICISGDCEVDVCNDTWLNCDDASFNGCEQTY